MPMATTPPLLLIVRDTLGLPSEQWIPRQAAGFSRLRTRFAGAAHDGSRASWDPGDYVRLPFATMLETPGRVRRLAVRLAGAVDGDPFSRRGGDRQRLFDAVAAAKPDAVLAHFGWTGLQLLPIAQRLGVPLAVHLHGFDVWSMAKRSRWYGHAMRRRLRSFDAVIVVGSHQTRWARSNGVAAGRVHCIPCGVPTDDFFPRAHERRAGPVRFIAVGRLHPSKGLDVVLRALRRAVDANADAELTVVGGGEDREPLQRLAAELDLIGRVVFCGPLSGDEVRERVRDADVLVQHSLRLADGSYEGFGVAAAEGAATGLPTLVSDCGGLLDQVVDGETGLVTPQGDVEALASAMQRLSADASLRARLGAAGRQRMVDRFDAKDQAAKVERVILALTERGGPGDRRAVAGGSDAAPHALAEGRRAPSVAEEIVGDQNAAAAAQTPPGGSTSDSR